MPDRNDDAMDDYCPNCGAHTGGDSICPNCGIEIFDDSGLAEYDEDAGEGAEEEVPVKDDEEEGGHYKH